MILILAYVSISVKEIKEKLLKYGWVQTMGEEAHTLMLVKIPPAHAPCPQVTVK